MTDRGAAYPDWLVVDAGMPRCLRCGAAWDRTLAAEADAALADREDYVRADAVLRGLVAFADHHRWCGGGSEAAEVHPGMVAERIDEPAPVAPPTPMPAEVPPLPPELAPSPRPACCPRCGVAYRYQGYRRCYSAQCQRPVTGECPQCGKAYGKVRRCFACRPTPVMLRHKANGKA